MSSSSDNRYIVLDGIRGIIAIGIMLYHYSATYNSIMFANIPSGVDLFFMLSGFVLSYSYGRKILEKRITYSEFILRRFIRLYPMFVFGLPLGGFALYLLAKSGYADYSPGQVVNSVICNLLFLPYLNNDALYLFEKPVRSIGIVSPSDGASWSLSFELLANLFLFYLIRQPTKKLSAIATIALIITIIMGFMSAHALHYTGLRLDAGWERDTFLQGFPRVAFAFTIGIIIHRMVAAKEKAGTIPGGFARIFVKQPVLLYVVLTIVMALPFFWHGVTMLLTVLFFCPVAIYLGAFGKLRNPYLIKTSNYLGWLSYPLYCIHIPLGNLVAVARHEGGMTAFIPLSFIATAAIVGISISSLVGWFYDDPVRNYVSRKWLPLVSKKTA